MKMNVSIKPIIMLTLLAITIVLLTGCNQSDKAIVQINEFITKQNIDKTKSDWKTHLSKPPQLEFSKNKTYIWQLKTTQGDMEIGFLPQESPMHVSSTIYLTNLGFYDDIVFHRVIKGFMAQGGDPIGNGTGGPGYKYDGEYDGKSKHDKEGTLSMANAGQGTDGSQFFLTFKATPHLNGKHTVFGYLVEGLDVLKSIESLGSRRGKTKEKIKIVSAKILVK